MAIRGKHHNRPKVVTALTVASALFCMASGSVPLPKIGEVFYLPIPLERHMDDFWRPHRGIVKIDACEEMKVVAIDKESDTFHAVVVSEIICKLADELVEKLLDEGDDVGPLMYRNCFEGPGWTEWIAKTKDDCNKMRKREDLPKPFRESLCFRIEEREEKSSNDTENIPKEEDVPDVEPYYAGTNGVTIPELIPSSKVSPKYPAKARKKKVQGTVILQAVVRKDGTVGSVTVLKSPGPRFDFDEAAMVAVRQWRYKPALKDGKPVDVHFTLVVDFVLQ